MQVKTVNRFTDVAAAQLLISHQLISVHDAGATHRVVYRISQILIHTWQSAGLSRIEYLPHVRTCTARESNWFVYRRSSVVCCLSA